ncbi:uncharacterized protein LOC119913473 [Micropterus salmoides]|uniref:uncharacterized protein LOC119913473 n=1 Tax=Micropterus salmoides TaxID=27706 RepID=UPI0018EC867C|nr:uncharacterized protein LOC119913473 [Micropterus salmoides]
MIWILLLVGLTSSICGAFVVKRTSTFYQTEEGDNITISWDSPTKADMSLTNLLCFLQSKPVKRLYQMVNGVEVPESQHQQFAGRVQCDKAALRDGRLRLLCPESRLTTLELTGVSLAADYDQDLRRWVLQTSEQFVLNVTSRGENSDVFLTTPEAAKHKPEGPEKGVSSYELKVKTFFGAVQVAIFLLGSAIIAVLSVLKCVSQVKNRKYIPSFSS